MGDEKNQESRVQKHPERTTVINEERSEESIGKKLEEQVRKERKEEKNYPLRPKMLVTRMMDSVMFMAPKHLKVLKPRQKQQRRE